MASQNNILAALQLFDGTGVVLTVEDIAQALGVSVRTAYRTVRELAQAGFLDPVTGAGYALGPAFIHYDRLIRQADPLIRLADQPMADLLDQAGQAGAVILCRRFRDRIMSIHTRDGQAPHLPASYERGAGMSLFRGAPAKVILAFLPDRALRALYLRNEEDLRRSGVTAYADLRASLKTVRKQGYAVTSSEVGPGRLGVAAPILRGDMVVACISLVADAHHTEAEGLVPPYVEAVVATAARISMGLESQDTRLTRA